MNRSLGPGLLPREQSPAVHPHGMPGWITEKPDGSGAVWKVEGESGNECSNQFFRLLAALLRCADLAILWNSTSEIVASTLTEEARW